MDMMMMIKNNQFFILYSGWKIDKIQSKRTVLLAWYTSGTEGVNY